MDIVQVRQEEFSFTFDTGIGRYRDLATGQFVAQARVRSFVGQSLFASTEVASELGTWAGTGSISASTFRDLMRQEIKEEYIRQYVLGKGGLAQMTQADWGSVGGMVGDQYRFLDGFTDAINAGELTEGQIRARARMYTNSAREAYERARGRVMVDAGLEQVRWVPTGSNTCVDCLANEALGWTATEDNAYGGCYPGSGCTVCLTNCNCYLDYRQTPPERSLLWELRKRWQSRYAVQ